jgi:ABC-2 type transport system ATP-binding protein
MLAIETSGLTKIYHRKSQPAIADLTMKIAVGELFGFLGPNGAGKTTTIRILTTLIRPTSGRALVNGHNVVSEPLEAKLRIGYTPEQPGFYPALTGKQHLRYWGRLYHLDSSQLDGRSGEQLRRVGLSEVADARVRTYSLGMRRRLALAGALLPDPELLILDEPSLGLDPQGMAFVRNLLSDLHREGRTVFLSSHNLSEVERVCTQVGVLHHGRLLRVDSPRGLAQALVKSVTCVEVETQGVDRTALDRLNRISGLDRLEVTGNTVRVFGTLEDSAIAEVTRTLVEAGVAILASRRIEPALEDAFLALTGETP